MELHDRRPRRSAQMQRRAPIDPIEAQTPMVPPQPLDPPTGIIWIAPTDPNDSNFLGGLEARRELSAAGNP
jgi:hypothetical protein